MSPPEIANVWASYALFQNVIDDFLGDGRIGNLYARPLRFHSSMKLMPAEGEEARLEDVSTHNARYYLFPRQVFQRLHAWVNWAQRVPGFPALDVADDGDFCDFVMQGEHGRGDRRVCARPGENWYYPDERYWQVNMVVLNKYGTLEFRAYPSSPDTERVLHWVRLVTTFVERMRHVDHYFAPPSAEDALFALEQDQALASLVDLERALDLDLGFFRQRNWERLPDGTENPACRRGVLREHAAAHAELQLARLEAVAPQLWLGDGLEPEAERPVAREEGTVRRASS